MSWEAHLSWLGARIARAQLERISLAQLGQLALELIVSRIQLETQLASAESEQQKQQLMSSLNQLAQFERVLASAYWLTKARSGSRWDPSQKWRFRY